MAKDKKAQGETADQDRYVRGSGIDMPITDDERDQGESEEWLNSQFLCEVHRLNCERENADLPISVTVIGKKRRVFNPGDRVALYGYHIGVLRNAVEDTQIELPPESAIYEESNPIAKAEMNFPGFRARLNSEDGSITLVKRLPLYSVNIMKKVKGPEG